MRDRVDDQLIGDLAEGECSLTYDLIRGRSVWEIDRMVDAFLCRLARMSLEERVRASRYGGFTRWERWVWAARFPEQVPLINGEYEWIAVAGADLD